MAEFARRGSVYSGFTEERFVGSKVSLGFRGIPFINRISLCRVEIQGIGFDSRFRVRVSGSVLALSTVSRSISITSTICCSGARL